MLRDYIDSITNENNEKDLKFNTELKESKIRLKDLEGLLTNKDEAIRKLTMEVELLKTNLITVTEKNKNNEITLKMKMSHIFEIEESEKGLKSTISQLEDTIRQLEDENKRLSGKVDEAGRGIQSVEKENFELLRKNKNLLVSYESLQADILKQNQVLTLKIEFTKSRCKT
jgi:chromosome segregation ATPase